MMIPVIRVRLLYYFLYVFVVCLLALPWVTASKFATDNAQLGEGEGKMRWPTLFLPLKLYA
jgi:hypothetical protein